MGQWFRSIVVTLLAAVLVAAAPSLGAAQASTSAVSVEINKAIGFYENLDIEAARQILSQIVSPSYTLQVSESERATAFKYLGATYAQLGTKDDSAKIYFRAALDRDPFTDLDPTKFSPREVSVFGAAKSEILKVGMRQIPPAYVVDPQADTNRFAFQFVTTHSTNTTIELSSLSLTPTGGATQKPDSVHDQLFQGTVDGPKDIRWTGRLINTSIAEQGMYEIKITSRSNMPTLQGQTATDRQLFRVERVFAPLEDTLPDLKADVDLLPERYPAWTPIADAFKGLALTGAAFGVYKLFVKPAYGAAIDSSQYKTPFVVGIGVGTVATLFTSIYRAANRSIDGNVRENAARRARRVAFNSAVKVRNDDRKSKTLLVITPVSGAGR